MAKINKNKDEYNPDDKVRKNLLENSDQWDFELMDHIKKLADNPKLRRIAMEEKIVQEYYREVDKYGHPPQAQFLNNIKKIIQK